MLIGGAYGVMVIVVGNGHGDKSWTRLITFHIALIPLWRCPRGVMVKAMDCGIVVSEFELHSRYYVHFRANTESIGKGMNPPHPPSYGLNSTTTVLLGE